MVDNNTQLSMMSTNYTISPTIPTIQPINILTNYLDVEQNFQERVYKFVDGVDGNPAYASLLDWLSCGKDNILDPYVKDASSAIGCTTWGNTYECPDHGIIYGPHTCRERKVCVICGDSYTKSRVSPVMRLFNEISVKFPDLCIQSVIFTLPQDLQPLLNFRNFRKFQQLCKAVLVEYHGGKQLAGFQTSHTWHSSNPLGGWYPHIHSFWLNLAYDKGQSQFEQVAHYIDVKRLNTLYRKALSKFFGQEVRSVNLRVHYDQFTDETRPKIYQHLKYALRMYQLDLVKFSNYNEITAYSEHERSNILVHLLPPRNWRRSQWFGWLCDSGRKKYLHLLDITGFKMHEKTPVSERPPVRCPVCFREVELVENGVSRKSLIDLGTPFHYPALEIWDRS